MKKALILLIFFLSFATTLNAEYNYPGSAENPEGYFTGKEGVSDCIVDEFDLTLMANDWLSDVPIPIGLGALWKFDEESGGIDYATEPWPNDEQMGLPRDVELSWQSGSDTVSHDLYFSDDFNDVNEGMRLAADIDGDKIVGLSDVEAMGNQIAGPPAGPYPADLDDDNDVDLIDYAIFAEEYLQECNDPAFVGTFIDNQYTPDTLEPNKTYYWRVDERAPNNITYGDIWSFTTADVAALEISMLEPNSYEVKYDSFNVGELMYIDRSYTFTNVASLAGETYIKTANDDKYLTNEVRVVFNTNQDCTVYVAFDDRISPDPAWLSDFTDTGENISTGGDPYSLFAKDFDAGTVVLGGNSGGVSSSMYGIIVAAKGTGFIIRPDVLNDNFEYPDVSGYQYSPSGSDWSYSGNFIIADSGSAFGNTAYEGSQNMVLQGPVTVWQDVSGFEVGKTYVVRWVEADRAGAVGDNSLRVWIDGTIVGDQHTVDDENWDVIRSTEFVATSYTHTLKFETLNSGDHSAFIDAVSVCEYLSVKEWLRSRPFTVYALNLLTTSPGCNNIAQYTAAGMNNLMAWFEVARGFNGSLGQAAKASAGGLPWHGGLEIRHGQYDFQYQANIAGSYSLQNGILVQDEPFGNEIDAMAKAAYWHKRHYPTIPLYSNNKGPQDPEDLWGDPGYPPGYDWDDYMDDQLNKFDADALMYDYYPFNAGTSTSSGWWSQCMQVRNKAVAAGVPCFVWVQAWANYNHRLPSESDVRMYDFVHLAAGYQGIGYFTYDNAVGDTAILDDSGNPTALYYDLAEINPEIINLGYCLRYLTSQAVRFVPGELFAGYENSTPSGWTDWSSGAGGDNNITNVDIDHSQGGTYGSKKNGVIGFFTDDAGQKYFMLTNTNHAAGTDPEPLSLPFIIDFDDETTLLELDRETGNTEVVNLTNNRLSVTLIGGGGRLYKYNTGVGFAPDVPLP